MTWIWLTMRRPTTKTVLPDKPPSSLSGLFAMIEHGPDREVTGWTDILCLYDLATHTLLWERPADEEVSFRTTILTTMLSHEQIAIADTLDEFADRVGAPPRPRIEVPEVFKD